MQAWTIAGRGSGLVVWIALVQRLWMLRMMCSSWVGHAACMYIGVYSTYICVLATHGHGLGRRYLPCTPQHGWIRRSAPVPTLFLHPSLPPATQRIYNQCHNQAKTLSHQNTVP